MRKVLLCVKGVEKTANIFSSLFDSDMVMMAATSAGQPVGKKAITPVDVFHQSISSTTSTEPNEPSPTTTLGIPSYKSVEMAYLFDPWVRACVRFIAGSCASNEWSIDPIPGGPPPRESDREKLLNLIRYPNREENFWSIRYKFFEKLSIWPVGGLEIRPGVKAKNVPRGLWNIDGDVVKNEEGNYVQTLSDGRVKTIDSPYVCPIYYPTSFTQASFLSSVALDIYSAEKERETEGNFYARGGQIDTVAELPKGMSPQSEVNVRRAIENWFRAKVKPNVPFIGIPGLKFQQTKLTPDKMDIEKAQERHRNDIVAVMGMFVEILIGGTGGGLGTGGVSDLSDVCYERTIVPYLQLFSQAFNHYVAVRYGIYSYGLFFPHKNPDPRSMARQVQVGGKFGIYSVNAMLQKLGDKPIDHPQADIPLIFLKLQQQPTNMAVKSATQMAAALPSYTTPTLTKVTPILEPMENSLVLGLDHVHTNIKKALPKLYQSEIAMAASEPEVTGKQVAAVALFLAAIRGMELQSNMVDYAKTAFLLGSTTAKKEYHLDMGYSSTLPKDLYDEIKARANNYSMDTLGTLRDGGEQNRPSVRGITEMAVAQNLPQARLNEELDKLFTWWKTVKVKEMARTIAAREYNLGRIETLAMNGLETGRMQLGSDPCVPCQEKAPTIHTLDEARIYFMEEHNNGCCTWVPTN